MSNKMRWRYGESNPVRARPSESSVIEIGDIVCLDTDGLKSSSELDVECGGTNLQLLLHATFLGVAMQESCLDEVGPIRVSTSGVFGFQCEPGNYQIGDLIGGALRPDAERLLSQSVSRTASITCAIGRCAEAVSPGSDEVLVDIASSVMRGGPQSIA